MVHAAPQPGRPGDRPDSPRSKTGGRISAPAVPQRVPRPVGARAAASPLGLVGRDAAKRSWRAASPVRPSSGCPRVRLGRRKVATATGFDDDDVPELRTVGIHEPHPLDQMGRLYTGVNGACVGNEARAARRPRSRPVACKPANHCRLEGDEPFGFERLAPRPRGKRGRPVCSPVGLRVIDRLPAPRSRTVRRSRHPR